MKANGPKRKIFDAVDMMTADIPQAETGNGLQSLPVDSIKPFHDHPFRLYQGERLDDMVESIKEHGILTPVIVRKNGSGYEMLAGHNRQNAARIAGRSAVWRALTSFFSTFGTSAFAATLYGIMPSFTACFKMAEIIL